MDIWRVPNYVYLIKKTKTVRLFRASLFGVRTSSDTLDKYKNQSYFISVTIQKFQTYNLVLQVTT